MRHEKEAFIRTYTHRKELPNDNEIRDIALKSAIKAAFMHNKTYSNDADYHQRRNFRFFFRQLIAYIGEKYLNNVQTFDTFISDIQNMKATINEQFANILYDNSIRIGHCQKALAIYLKWMWCHSNNMPAPPMCPIDRNILSYCGINGNYTQLDDINLYRQWAETIIGVANANCENELFGHHCTNVAEWELVVFNHINQ